MCSKLDWSTWCKLLAKLPIKAVQQHCAEHPPGAGLSSVPVIEQLAKALLAAPPFCSAWDNYYSLTAYQQPSAAEISRIYAAGSGRWQMVADQLSQLDRQFCTGWLLAGGAEVLLDFTETVVPLQQTCTSLINTAVALLQQLVSILRHALVHPVAVWGTGTDSGDVGHLCQACVSCGATERLVKMLPMIAHSDHNIGNICSSHCQVFQIVSTKDSLVHQHGGHHDSYSSVALHRHDLQEYYYSHALFG